MSHVGAPVPGPDPVPAAEERGLYLTDREVAILAHLLVAPARDMDPTETRDALARLFTTRATVRITRERVRQIESKLISKLRGTAGHQWGRLDGGGAYEWPGS